MKKITFLGIAASLILFGSCTQENTPVEETINQQETTNMTHTSSQLISLFEIPASDISRAISFYEEILSIDIEQMDVDGMKMGIFPTEGQPVSGILIETEGYAPSADGSVLYFNAKNDLESVLDIVEKNGGEIILPKTMHADESGYFAIILDSEGNKIGLNAPQ